MSARAGSDLVPRVVAAISRQPRSAWRLLVCVVDGEVVRLRPRAQVVRELLAADLHELAAAVRSAAPRQAAIVIVEIGELGCRVSELSVHAAAPRVLWTSLAVESAP